MKLTFYSIFHNTNNNYSNNNEKKFNPVSETKFIHKQKGGSIFFLLNKLLIMDLTMAKVCTKQKRLVDIHIIKMPT